MISLSVKEKELPCNTTILWTKSSNQEVLTGHEYFHNQFKYHIVWKRDPFFRSRSIFPNLLTANKCIIQTWWLCTMDVTSPTTSTSTMMADKHRCLSDIIKLIKTKYGKVSLINLASKVVATLSSQRSHPRIHPELAMVQFQHFHEEVGRSLSISN